MVPLRLACAIRDAELAAAVHCCLRELPVRIVLDQQDLQSFSRQLRGVRPDVALIEAGETGEPGEWVGRVKSGPDGPMVIVIDRTANPSAILSAFRAGADEFLYPPLEDNLRNALERESDRLRRRSEASGPRARSWPSLPSKAVAAPPRSPAPPPWNWRATISAASPSSTSIFPVA